MAVCTHHPERRQQARPVLCIEGRSHQIALLPAHMNKALLSGILEKIREVILLPRKPMHRKQMWKGRMGSGEAVTF